MNTKLEYLYRDGSNYKQWGERVFRSVCDAALRERLFSSLECYEFFIAHQVRLPDLFFSDRPLYADDHCWHELAEVSLTCDPPDDPLDRTIDEFVLEVERVSTIGWKVFDRAMLKAFVYR